MAGEKKKNGGPGITLQLTESGDSSCLLLDHADCLFILWDFTLLQLGLLGGVLKGLFSAEVEV